MTFRVLTLPFYFFPKKKTTHLGFGVGGRGEGGGKVASHSSLWDFGHLRPSPVVRFVGESTWFVFSDSIPRTEEGLTAVRKGNADAPYKV